MTRQTVRELAPAIGSTVRVYFEGLTFECQVIDAKNSYGKIRLCVKPVAGTGTKWIETSRLGSFIAEPATASKGTFAMEVAR